MVENGVHKETALGLKRDKLGHFLKSKQPNVLTSISSILTKNVSTGQADDETLVNIHINNPLTKIVELLKDIKKQKALTFSFKGSLGVVGVTVILMAGGILGGNKLLCNKGVQVRIGQVQVLAFSQDTASVQPIRAKLRAILGISPPTDNPKELQWVVLIDSQNIATKLSFADQAYLDTFAGHTVTAVGDYNMCTQELKILPKGLQDYIPL